MKKEDKEFFERNLKFTTNIAMTLAIIAGLFLSIAIGSLNFSINYSQGIGELFINANRSNLTGEMGLEDFEEIEGVISKTNTFFIGISFVMGTITFLFFTSIFSFLCSSFMSYFALTEKHGKVKIRLFKKTINVSTTNYMRKAVYWFTISGLSLLLISFLILGVSIFFGISGFIST